MSPLMSRSIECPFDLSSHVVELVVLEEVVDERDARHQVDEHGQQRPEVLAVLKTMTDGRTGFQSRIL